MTWKELSQEQKPEVGAAQKTMSQTKIRSNLKWSVHDSFLTCCFFFFLLRSLWKTPMMAVKFKKKKTEALNSPGFVLIAVMQIDSSFRLDRTTEAL